MKKVYKMIDLDCANCAAKMEEAIKKVEGVKDVSISFMMQKMTIDISDTNSEEIIKKVKKICKKIEPDCEIEEK